MKLQEKFERAGEVYNSNFEIIKDYEKISDDFAIGFSEWSKSLYVATDFKLKNTKELLEIYKKEKGL